MAGALWVRQYLLGVSVSAAGTQKALHHSLHALQAGVSAV